METKSVRPREVTLAYLLLLGSLALGLFKVALVPVPGPVWIAIAVLAVMLGLSVAIAKGKRWARTTFLVLFLLGIPALFLVREALANQGVLSVTILVAQTVAQLAAMILLFLPASRPWFSSKSATEAVGKLS